MRLRFALMLVVTLVCVTNVKADNRVIYSEDFEGYAEGTLPPDWATDAGGYISISTNQAQAGTNALQVADHPTISYHPRGYVTLPRSMDAEPFSFSYNWRLEGTNTQYENVIVAMSTNAHTSGFKFLISFSNGSNGRSSIYDPAKSPIGAPVNEVDMNIWNSVAYTVTPNLANLSNSTYEVTYVDNGLEFTANRVFDYTTPLSHIGFTFGATASPSVMYVDNLLVTVPVYGTEIIVN